MPRREILDFAFNNSWYAITDGLGFSLAVVGENADPDAWNSKTNWYPNGTLSGTPGQGNTQLPDIAPILITEVLSHTDPPLRDTVELWNPTTKDVNLGGLDPLRRLQHTQEISIPRRYDDYRRRHLTVDETLLTNAATRSSRCRGTGDEAWLYPATRPTPRRLRLRRVFGRRQWRRFGRYTNSVGKSTSSRRRSTRWARPGAPRVGPVVISEIISSARPGRWVG
jgi:hypothetical protein